MKDCKKIVPMTLAAFFALGAAYLALLSFPQCLFGYQFSSGTITLYCDDPIPSNAGVVLEDVQKRLEKCPLYSTRPHQNVFICDHVWDHYLFFRNSRAGGLAYCFPPWNVFFRKSDIAENILPRRDGTSSGPDRPLSYFIAHEITHILTARYLGSLAYWRLPVWMKERYADYVGKGGQFDFKRNLALFKMDDPALDPKASGLYLRYHLLVAELLDRRKISVESMLKGNYEQGRLEADLRLRKE